MADEMEQNEEGHTEPVVASEPVRAVAVPYVSKETVSSWFSFHKIYRYAWVILGLLVVVTYVGIYAFHSQNSAVRKLASFVPTPYGVVGNHPLWLSVFDNDVSALSHFYAQQGTSQQAAIPSADDIKKIARDNMVRRAEANILAGQYGIHVKQSEVNEQYKKTISSAGSEDSVVRTVRNLWGWSIEDYKRNVIQPFVLKMKLLEVLKNDPVIGREFAQTSDVQALDQYLNKLVEGKVQYWYPVL